MSSSNDEADDKPKEPTAVVNRLLAKCDEFLKKGQKVSSPVKKKPSSRKNSNASSSSGKNNQRKSGERMTEAEEDDIIMQDEQEQLDEEPVISRLRQQPSNIVGGTMRPYQLEGLNWMISLWKGGISGILADEMGLGKTLQSISILAYLRLFQKNRGPHLVVVPLTTLGNWMNEFKRWCPSIPTFRFHGTKDERAEMLANELNPKNERTWEVCVTSYEMINKHLSVLKKYDWDYCIVDEAHRLKNESSSLSKSLRILNSKQRLLITGTPLQNNLHELWALLNFLLPNIFDDSEEFDDLFSADDAEKKTVLEQLHRLLRPFMIRRLKVDVEKTLLPKKETLVFVGMSEIQKKMYLSIFHKNMDAVRGISKEKTALLNTIMQLRKCANHPYLFDGVEDRSLPLYGDHLMTNAGKMVVLDKLLTRLKQRGSRVLIFSQMTRVLDILEDYCFWREHQYCRIDGSTGTMEREERMKDFNAPNSEKFLFLLSTRAGGLGINLYTADIVILFDSDWNPQMDLQAQDRAHRIGQKKQVYVYRFVTEGTIEEKMIERAEIKLRLDAMVIQQGQLSNKNKLTKNEMIDMIRYGADTIFRSKESTITDEDIEAILSRGEAKTEERNEKLQKHVAGGEFKFDATSFVDENEDEIKPLEVFEDLVLINQMHDALGKRERKLRNKDMSEANYFRNALSSKDAGEKKGPGVKKVYDWQFIDEKRLKDLNAKEAEYMLQNKYNDGMPETNLTEAELEERRQLTKFAHWKHADFRAYIRGMERFGRQNMEAVFKMMLEQKPHLNYDEVVAYDKLFVVRGPKINGYERIMKGIIQAETKMKKSADLRDCLEKLFVSVGDSKQAALTGGIVPPTGVNLVHKGYTKLADCFLLYVTHKHGYGSWNEVQEEVVTAPEFCYDFFLRSRTPLDLSRRVDSLLRLQAKVYAKKRKLEQKVTKTNSTASSSPTKKLKPNAAATPAAQPAKPGKAESSSAAVAKPMDTSAE